jgi:hypothetical protein
VPQNDDEELRATPNETGPDMTDGLQDQLEALERRIRRLEDDSDIRLALVRYGHTYDAGQGSEWVDCFTDDAVYDHLHPNVPSEWQAFYPFAEFDDKGWRMTGRPTLQKFIDLQPADGAGKHLILDHVISRGSDPDRATSVSYFVRVDELNGDRVITAYGRYLDDLVRCEDGRWRFEKRRIDLQSLAADTSVGPDFGRTK